MYCVCVLRACEGWGAARDGDCLSGEVTGGNQLLAIEFRAARVTGGWGLELGRGK